MGKALTISVIAVVVLVIVSFLAGHYIASLDQTTSKILTDEERIKLANECKENETACKLFQEDCIKRGGKVVGLFGQGCVFKTSDFGNSCFDGSECEGDCVADLTEAEMNRLTLGSISKNGTCSEFDSMLGGCFAPVENGEVVGELCVD